MAQKINKINEINRPKNMRFFFPVETLRKLKANEAEQRFNTDVLAPEDDEGMTINLSVPDLCLSGGMVKLKKHTQSLSQ